MKVVKAFFHDKSIKERINDKRNLDISRNDRMCLNYRLFKLLSLAIRV